MAWQKRPLGRFFRPHHIYTYAPMCTGPALHKCTQTNSSKSPNSKSIPANPHPPPHVHPHTDRTPPPPTDPDRPGEVGASLFWCNLLV